MSHTYYHNGKYVVYFIIQKVSSTNHSLKGFASVHSQIIDVWCGEENNNLVATANTQLRIFILLRAVGKVHVSVDGEGIVEVPPHEISGT